MTKEHFILGNNVYTIGKDNNLIEKGNIKSKEVVYISKNHNTPRTGNERTNQEFLNKSAFAALKEDGSVVTWGNSLEGGDSSDISLDLKNVSQIFSTVNSFAALKEDGSVVTWGSDSGGGDSSDVSSELQQRYF